MTTKTLHRALAAGLVVTLSAVASSAVSAQTRVKPGFNLFSTDQDLEIGRQSAAEVESQLPMLQDRSIEAYANAIGKRLAAVIPGTKFPYQFKIVNASDINAFALPGGYMYLNRGLIEAAKSEGQLAGVMAHEMSHVALRHGTNQASKAYLGQAGLGLLGGLLNKDDKPNRMIDAVGGFGLNALFLKFSRTDEEQADVVGAQTMAKAGYDPKDMIDFFELLRSKQAREPSKVEQFFSSHPAPQDRAARIRNETKLLTVRPTQPVGGFKQAKAELAAMPVARSMQQIAKNQPASPAPRTFTEGRIGDINVEAPASTFRAFEQRDRLFRIDYPSNWNVVESADRLGVTLAPNDGFVDAGGREKDLIYGVVIRHYEPFLNDANDTNGRFSFVEPGATSGRTTSRTHLAAATNDLIDQIVRTNPTLKLVPDSQRTDTIDGASALSLVLSGQSAVTRQEERVTVFTRELPDEHIIYALFIAPGRDYAQHKGTFERMIASLRVNDDHAGAADGRHEPLGSAGPGTFDGVRVTVPGGTEVHVTLSALVGSATSRVGDTLSATTTAPVLVGDRVAIPTGSTIHGRVTGVSPAKKGLDVSDKGGAVALSFDRVTTPRGFSSPISASLARVAKSGKKTTQIIGGSAAGGALLGKILGGSTKDAAVGAVLGGGIGTGIAAGTKGKELVIPKGTALAITLNEPLTIADRS
jgi:beta-barrel assembly-enhancing protease